MNRDFLKARLFGDVENYGLEHRCYNGICLFAGLGCMLASIVNILVGTGWLATLATFLIGLVFLTLWLRARRRPGFQPLYEVFVANGVALLIVTWFGNGGTSGTATIVAMAALVALVTVLDRNPFRFVGAVLLPLISLLFLVEYFAPYLVTPYSGRAARFIDLYLTFLLATFVIFQIILLILQAYREERARAAQMNADLSRNLEELHRTNRALGKALAEVKSLSGLLPICSACQKIRNDKGYWDRIDTYIQAHTEATFSHSLCPECAHRLYPDIFQSGEYASSDGEKAAE